MGRVIIAMDYEIESYITERNSDILITIDTGLLGFSDEPTSMCISHEQLSLLASQLAQASQDIALRRKEL